MLLFAEAYPAVLKCLPSEKREIEKLHRDYVSTVIFTIVGKPFSDWVESKIKDRNDEVEDKQDMNVYMDPEIAAILKNSSSVSVAKGISNNLFKVGHLTSFDFSVFLICTTLYRTQQSEDGRRHRSKKRSSRS